MFKGLFNKKGQIVGKFLGGPDVFSDHPPPHPPLPCSGGSETLTNNIFRIRKDSYNHDQILVQNFGKEKYQIFVFS